MTAELWAGLALGAGWALAVAIATTTHARRRDARLVHAAHAPTRPRSPITHVGAAIRRLSAPGRVSDPQVAVAPAGGSRSSFAAGGSAAGVAADRRVGWAVVAGVGLLFVAPPLAGVPLVWTVAAPALAARRDTARHEAHVHDQLPDVVDLVALTAAAGLPVAASVLAIGDRPGGPLGTALALAGAQLRRGASTSEALAALATAGPPARPLVDALIQHDRYGTPLLPSLGRVAVEARARRRRRAEEAARRLPVTLLFPLVLTVFPAFVLLTVVPLLAGSLGSLSLTTP